METKKCRVCKHDLFKEPLLCYQNMPKGAQYLPDEKSVKTDKGTNLEVCQCSSCGLVQLTNKPVPYYKEVIRAAGISAEMQQFRLKQFRKFLKKYALTGKKAVEIGCGKGEYLALMQESGADAYGLEEASGSVRECIQKGLKVQKGFIEKQTDKIKNSPFDAFFILNFLEHIPNPNELLKGIRNNLKENGIGIVEVPNFDMILEKCLFSEFIGDHLFYFTQDTLKTALSLNGFEIIERKVVWHDYIISAIVRKSTASYPVKLPKTKKLDLTKFYQYQSTLKKELKRYLRGSKGKKVAIWGAGHQALAVIALTDIADQIHYVVDSAPFKQGKYTPATHIPIVSPDTLETNPVDTVIIIAASYSDEVARIIKQQYNRNLDIAILRDYGLERNT
jgi:2-polyprenyl-3-methyl-5-hydroxy-6-metoxy-1,4-benzoquinol methylase